MSGYCPYDETSKSYDNTRSPLGLKIVLGSLAESCVPLEKQSLLDIGCGTGTFLDAVRSKLGSVVGLEYSDGMISKARDRLGDQVRLVQGSAENLPFEDEAFHACTINQVVHHFPKDDNYAFAKRVFNEAFRVLKPGGHLVINTSTPEQQRDAFWWMCLFPRASGSMCQRFPPIETLISHLKDAGFTTSADSVIVPLARTLMAEDQYLKHGVRAAFMPTYRAGDSSWAEAENMGELDEGLKELQRMIDDGVANAWLDQREGLRKAMGQATFLSVRKSEQKRGPGSDTNTTASIEDVNSPDSFQATDIQTSLWPDNNSTDPRVVAETYNDAAATYEENIMKDGWGVSFEKLRPELDLALEEGAKIVLDAGCSTGLLPKVYQMPSDVKMHGVDISKECLASAKAGGHYVSLTEANLEDALPFDSEHFDLVICNGVLGYIATNKPLSELVRVLKPGGRLLMAFRHHHYLEREYDKKLAHASTGCKLERTELYDPFPLNPAYRHDYILAVARKD